MILLDLYKQLFGKEVIADGNVIDMAEHGRVGNLSTGTAFKNTNILSPFLTELDYSGGTDPIYIGAAIPGSLTSDPVWQIKKIAYDVNSNPTSILCASGTAEYNQIWDNRASLSYS